jgi:hypothetical protein
MIPFLLDSIPPSYISVVKKVMIMTVLSGSCAMAARCDGEHQAVLMLSRWWTLWRILRSVIALPLKISMTIESNELC